VQFVLSFVVELSCIFLQQRVTASHVSSRVHLVGGVVRAGTGPSGQDYRSTDGGQSWPLVQGLGTESYVSHVWSLAYLGGVVVLAGTGPNGQVYRSISGGRSWGLDRKSVV